MFLVLAGFAKAANFAKCPAIEAVENEKKAGPSCDEDMCMRQCKNGFEPAEPTQVFCIKKTNGKFKWDGELGGCQGSGSNFGLKTLRFWYDSYRMKLDPI